jgi:stearoyl-CoA desaturase (Delta-9 desaturase)
MVIIIFFILQWYFSIFSQTFLQHRYAAHRSFKMNKFWERFFYVFAFISQGATYMSPRAYAVMHRMHHAYADTPKDPHSPSNHKNLFAMMENTRKMYTACYWDNIEVEKRFKKDVPDWPWFDAWADSRWMKVAWIAFYIGFYFVFATSPWLFLLLPVTILMNPVHAVIVNWYGHKIGYRNYELKNTSTNLYPMDIFFIGEAYHNDHHRNPSSINMGAKWYEFDLTYYIILAFSKIGIVTLQNKAHKLQHEKDLDLEASIIKPAADPGPEVIAVTEPANA